MDNDAKELLHEAYTEIKLLYANAELMKADLMYALDRVMKERSFSVFCTCESCERVRKIADRWGI
jgi:hypothetical protein